MRDRLDAAMVDALAERHGHPLAALAGRLEAQFELPSPWAPGLAFFGGTMTVGQDRFHVAGAGLDPIDAFACCLGEAAERASQVERPGDIALQATLAAARAQVPAPVAELVERLFAARTAANKVVDWVAARCVQSREPVLLPADWCLRRAAPGPCTIPGARLSSGAAAGPTFAAAEHAALLELVERDAAALWWLGGRPARRLDRDSEEAQAAAALLASYRRDARHRTDVVVQLTADFSIPVVAAMSGDPVAGGFVCGLAAGVTTSAAVAGAIREMLQMELGLLLAKRRAVRGEAAAPTDGDHLARAALSPGALLAEAEAPCAATGRLNSLAVVDRLARDNIPAWSVDLSRDDIGIPVVKVIAPDLQLFPGALVTRRLAREADRRRGNREAFAAISLL